MSPEQVLTCLDIYGVSCGYAIDALNYGSPRGEQ